MAPARRYETAAFGDGVQSLLLAVLVVVTIRNLASSTGRSRRFWIFMLLWAVGWLCGTLIWSWYEIVLKLPVPDVFIGDMLFFLLPVALMSALAVLPHAKQYEGPLAFSWLDFLILLLFWIYLYAVAVIPWEFVSLNTPQYSRNFDLLYAVETALPVLALIPMFLRAQGRWRGLYGMLFWASATFAVAVQVVNRALTVHSYYSGSLFDLGMVISTCIFIAALASSNNLPQPEPGVSTRLVGVLASRLAMAAVISLPFFALWSYWATMPIDVRNYRLAATGVALVVLQALVFLKKHLLECELTRLWKQMQASYQGLKRSHEQLIQTERLAMLVELVAVADDGINNPLTSILGYSALITEDQSLPPTAQAFLTKIVEQAHRVTEAMARLQQLAQRPLGLREPVHINQLLAEAVELRTLDIGEPSKIKVIRSFTEDLPPVIGDSSQLLQVFFCIIGNAIEDLHQHGGGTLSVGSILGEGEVIVEITEDADGLSPGRVNLMGLFDRSAGSVPSATSLALSACRNVIRDHRGQMSGRSLLGGGSAMTIELPATLQSAHSAGDVTPVVSRPSQGRSFF